MTKVPYDTQEDVIKGGGAELKEADDYFAQRIMLNFVITTLLSLDTVVGYDTESKKYSSARSLYIFCTK